MTLRPSWPLVEILCPTPKGTAVLGSLFRQKMTFVWEVEGVQGGSLSGTNLLTMRRNILPISSGATEGKERQKSPRQDPVQFYQTTRRHSPECVNPLNPELNPICCLLALLGARHFLHVSRIRVKLLTFRRLMSYIYGAPIFDVSRSHTTTQRSR